MKGGYLSVNTVLEHLSTMGASVPMVVTFFVMLIVACILLDWLNRSARFRNFRKQGGLSGHLTRKKIQRLREQGEVVGEFTFDNAIELSATGTIRKKSLEDKMVDCVIPVEILFNDVEHGIYYQFELGHVTRAEVTSWLEVARFLKLDEISEIFEEVLRLHNVICADWYDGEIQQGHRTLGEDLWDQAAALHAKMAGINGIAQLRSASEKHIRRNAPELLPLPTW